MEADNHRYIPEHSVPMQIKELMRSKSETIEFGTSDVVRVQVMGQIEKIEIGEDIMEFELADEEKKNKVMVQKLFTPSFPLKKGKEFKNNEYVEVYGKIRVLEEEKRFLNAFSIRKVSKNRHDAFKTLCNLSKNYFHQKSPLLPSGVSTTFPVDYGLKDRIGSLDRFPVKMLEESSSVENNGGVWPTELEELAAEVSVPKENIEDETEVNSEEEDDEVEDSFDAGPTGAAAIKEEPVKIEPDAVYDSFENIQ